MQLVVDNTSIELLETVTDTKSSYKAYYHAYNSSNAILYVYNSSNSINVSVFVLAAAGNTSVAGANYQVTGTSTVNTSSWYSVGQMIDIFTYEGDSIIGFGFKRSGSSSYDLCGTFYKLTEICAETDICAVSSACIGSYPYWAKTDGSCFNSFTEVSVSEINNGYIYAHPIRYVSSALGAFTCFANPTEICRIISKGASKSMSIGDVITVGGHEFICLSGKYFGRLS
jgi:hypothetical protein